MAARDAAEHAVNAEQAAQLATEHANAASTAAQIAVDSANQAGRIYTAARKADEDRIAQQADQATEAAQQALTVQDQLGLTRKWNAAQELQRDAETNRLLAEANAAGTDPNLVTLDGRKIALRLLATGGPWTKTAAKGALSGADREVQEFVHSGVALRGGPGRPGNPAGDRRRREPGEEGRRTAGARGKRRRRQAVPRLA